MGAIVVQAEGLSVGYPKRVVQHSLSFCLRSGTLACLLGANGVGKSTLLRTLCGAQPALEGSLKVMGKLLDAYSPRELSRVVGVVLTDKTYAGGLTVRELVALGRWPHTGFWGRLSRRDEQVVDEMLQRTGIAHKQHCHVAELSDGERQKAMIAKALVQEAPLIVLDEPTAFLDVVSRLEIMALLQTLAHDGHKAILLSTHDVEQALLTADELWLMSDDGITCGDTHGLLGKHGMDGLFARQGLVFDYEHLRYTKPTTPRENR